MNATSSLLLIGDGRLARHLSYYFEQVGIPHRVWSRRQHAEARCPALPALVERHTHALLAIADSAIEPFIAAHPELRDVRCIHFSGALSTSLATAAHPLFSFASTRYPRELYERIPFVLDRGAPPLTDLIPGLTNPAFFIDPAERPRYHAFCVLAGNFTTLLWRKFFFELESTLDIPASQGLPYLESITRGLMAAGAPLSGPLARGDAATIAKNLEALRGDPFEEVYRAFVSAFERQHERAAASGRDWLKS